MKKLELKKMEQIEGGMPCWLAASLYVVGTAGAVLTLPATAGGSLVLVSGMTAAMYHTLESCGLI
jgi:hypothetical protein